MVSTINFIKTVICTLSIILLPGVSSYSQSNQNQDTKSLKIKILELDTQFWKSYNTCDISTFKTFFVDDFEFYHDKDGLTSGLPKLIKSVENSLCNKDNPRVRREVVKGSVNVYPLNNYGAIITGEHVFYVSENDEEEQLSQIAKFTHVWQHTNEEWKMTRVLSYDHQPLSENTNKTEIVVSDIILNQYTGTYFAPETGTVIISKKEHLLEVKADKMQAIVYPSSEHLFFHKHSPLTFEFIKNPNGEIVKFIVRENGKIVEEAKKVKSKS